MFIETPLQTSKNPPSSPVIYLYHDKKPNYPPQSEYIKFKILNINHQHRIQKIHLKKFSTAN